MDLRPISPSTRKILERDLGGNLWERYDLAVRLQEWTAAQRREDEGPR